MALYVIDTNCIIAYFDQVFCSEIHISTHTRGIIQSAISPNEGNIKISIPSIVFVEIFEKWLKKEEFARKFWYEVYYYITESPNIEIKPIDHEVLRALIQIKGSFAKHDLHDKIVLASAITLGCKLISTDSKLKQYVEQTNIIPGIIS